MAFLIGGANSAADTTFSVANSCRFNDGDAPDLTRSKDASETSTQKGTFSFWFKRSADFGTQQYLYGSEVADDNNRGYIVFQSDETFRIVDSAAGSNQMDLVTTQLFRDPSAWMHFCIAIDTTQGTAANRAKMYINGTQVTDFGTETYPDQNDNLKIFEGGQTNKELIGGLTGQTSNLDGYLAEYVFIDGTQNAVTDFGEFDEDSPTIWKPIDVSGLTFGTNGFYLDFEDSADLGKDVSGNGDDFTTANLAATDQATDTPTNNFCTLNSLTGKKGDNTTFSEGNLKSVDTGSTDGVDPNLYATFGLTAGTWYFEMKAEAITAARYASIALLVHDGKGPESYADATTCNLYYERNSSNNNIRKFASVVETGLADNAADDIFGVALDIDNGTVQFYKNGSTYGSQVTGLASSGKTTFISMFGEGGAGRAFTCNVNFGSPAFAISSGNADDAGYGNFEYDVPAGFYALCTKNLAEYG